MSAPALGDRVAVLGAGIMGRGIAAVAAMAGARVGLVDVDRAQLDAAVEQIGRDLDGAVARGKLDADAAAAAREAVEPTSSVAAACDGAALVVEATTERIDVKREVLLAAEAAAPSDAVLATNTSALSITEIVAGLADPGRGCGMHFFNPVVAMPLCEIIAGLQSEEATLVRAEAAAAAMGKQTVRVADVPGFATTRLNALIGNEALRMLEEGVAAPEDLDTAVRLGLRHPMGPLEMGDLVGWDTRLAILEHLESRLGERFRPTTLQRRLVAAGHLGRKAGRGIYRYDDRGNRLE